MDISPKTQILPPRRSNRIDLDISSYIETPNPFGDTSFDADSSETFSCVPDELYNLFDSTTPDISGDKPSPDSKQESKDDFNPFSTASNKNIKHGDLSKANSFMVNDGSLFYKKLKPPGAFGGKRINRFELEFKNPAKSKTLGKTDSRLLETSDIDKSQVEKKSEIYSPSSKVFDVSPQGNDSFGNDSFEADYNSLFESTSSISTPSRSILKPSSSKFSVIEPTNERTPTRVIFGETEIKTYEKNTSKESTQTQQKVQAATGMTQLSVTEDESDMNSQVLPLKLKNGVSGRICQQNQSEKRPLDSQYVVRTVTNPKKIKKATIDDLIQVLNSTNDIVTVQDQSTQTDLIENNWFFSSIIRPEELPDWLD
jgi:hypothetical protein